MNAFQVIASHSGISAIFDNRYPERKDITDGTCRFGGLAYTLKSEDITTADKPEFVPYNDHIAGYDSCQEIDGRTVLVNHEHHARLTVTSLPDRLILDLSCDSSDVSACGLFLALNFMSCKNGDWQSQFLISSPYHTADKKHFLHYFTRPDGNHLACIPETEIDGYRINYSPYLSGHFIRGMELLSQFDRAYSRPERGSRRVKLHLIPVSSYPEALSAAAALWNIPWLYYDTAATCLGQPFTFEKSSDTDSIRIIAPSGKCEMITGNCYLPKEYGIHTAIPYSGTKPGADCSFFVRDELMEMHRRACASLPDDRCNLIGTAADGTPIWKPPYLYYRNYEDFNLCEHGMWCWSLLRYMRLAGICEPYASQVRNYLRIVTAEEGGLSLNACSMLPSSGYATKNSTRIQEAYNGVNILLDAYRVFGEREYLEFAVRALTARLESDMDENGGIFRHGSDGATAETADYTTVTCLVFPVVDMALLLQEEKDPRSSFFRDAAEHIADYVVRRGLSFPTEGGQHPEVNPEMEEGSMSCSALTVLYVAAHITAKPEYLQYAHDILAVHDAYTVHTPHPVMFASSLRWWETIWEGNSDGPAVCFGHAWSLWRAEAQFLYGILCKDDARLLDSYNGFMGNYAKEDAQGNMYAIYQYEPISSGAIAANGNEVDHTDCEGFPKRPDHTLSRYLFVRDFECWYKTAAVLVINGRKHFLNCHMENGILVIDAPAFENLYLSDDIGRLQMRCSTNDKGSSNNANIIDRLPHIISKKYFTRHTEEDGTIIVERQIP